jgi:hypothetical protein
MMSVSNKFWTIAITSGPPAIFFLLNGDIATMAILALITALAASFALETSRHGN